MKLFAFARRNVVLDRLDAIDLSGFARVLGAVLVAAVLAASLSPSDALASSTGSCAAIAVVASAPHVSDGAVHFDAAVVGEPSGYCYVEHGEIVGVKISEEEAPEQLERGQPVALAGRCGSDAMAGSGCGGWSLDGGEFRAHRLTGHMSKEQIEQLSNRPRNPDEAVEMTEDEIEQFIYRSRALRDRRCSVMSAVADQPKVTDEVISFEAIVYGEFSGMCDTKQKQEIEVRLERGACFADSMPRGWQGPRLRDETQLECAQFDEAADKLERGQAVPVVGRCTGGRFVECHQWGLDPAAFEKVAGSEDNLRYRLLADETDEAARALDQARKLATFEVVADEASLGVPEDYAGRIARRLQLDVRRCAMPVFRETAFSEGSLTVELEVDRGRVDKAAVSDSDLPESINNCVAKRAARLRLPRLDAESAERSVQVTISAGR
jgi:hypothetical protein